MSWLEYCWCDWHNTQNIFQAKWSGEKFYQLWNLPPKNSFRLTTMGWHPWHLMNSNYASNAYTWILKNSIWNFKITHKPYLFLHYLTSFFPYIYIYIYILLNIKFFIMYIKKLVTQFFFKIYFLLFWLNVLNVWF